VQRAKRTVLGPHVIFDAERCILCTRCIRFCREVPGTGELGIFSRGDRSEIGLFPGTTLDNPYSGNVVDICPVGALTSREYRFQSRPWDLVQHAESVCPLCSAGCNVILDVRHRQRGAEILRVRPRENGAVNRWWMCDEGRFGFTDHHDPSRLRTALRRTDTGQVEAPPDALAAAVAADLGRIVAAHGADAVGCIVSARHTTEELFLVRRFFRDLLGTPHLDHRVRPVQREAADASEDGILRRTDKTANGRGARDLDVLPGPNGLDAQGMIAAVKAGRLKALFVLEEDLVTALPDLAAREALEALPLLVVTSLLPNPTTALAHAVFPTLGFAEKAGSFVNFQGRIQKIQRALIPSGACQGIAEILRGLGRHLGWELGDIEPERVWAAIGERPGPYRGIGRDAWGGIGPMGATADELRAASREPRAGTTGPDAEGPKA
jgi:NADH-quinone oxidoreductase subunit G